MDLKRHVQDLRENIINNWATTGQELSRELRQYWPASRPASPARFGSRENININLGAGPSALSVNDIARSPGAAGASTNKEFVTGYALGLVGGVRSWVSCGYHSPRCRLTQTNRNLTDDQEQAECSRQPRSERLGLGGERWRRCEIT